MDKNLKSFRQIDPMEKHVFQNVSFSPANDLILVCGSNSQVF